MATLFDYVTWRGDLPFAQQGCNPLDGAIFARLAYLPFHRVVPDAKAVCPLRDAAQALLSLPERSFSDNDAQLLQRLIDAPRFRDLPLRGIVDRLSDETQFAAVTIQLPQEAYLSFRGTDNTLVGWKEDFNMTFVCPVPAQKLALAYTEQTAEQLPGKLRLGGHSKGGNLAVYAAAFCQPEVQRRVTGVYNFDGPGFDEIVLQNERYDRICSRVQTFVPQSSVVGMMLGHEEQYTVVSSTSVGIMQHNLYSWDVAPTGFVCLEEVTNGSRFMDFTLKTWLKDMTPAQRETFFDTIYGIMVQTNAKTFRELTDNWFQNALSIARTVKNLDEDTRKAVTQALSLLLKSASTGLEQMIRKPNEKA